MRHVKRTKRNLVARMRHHVKIYGWPWEYIGGFDEAATVDSAAYTRLVRTADSVMVEGAVYFGNYRNEVCIEHDPWKLRISDSWPLPVIR